MPMNGRQIPSHEAHTLFCDTLCGKESCDFPHIMDHQIYPSHNPPPVMTKKWILKTITKMYQDHDG